jgi:hypothetical protein
MYNTVVATSSRVIFIRVVFIRIGFYLLWPPYWEKVDWTINYSKLRRKGDNQPHKKDYNAVKALEV